MWRLLVATLLLTGTIGVVASGQANARDITSVVNNPAIVVTPPTQPVTTPTTTLSGSSAPNTTLRVTNNRRVVATIQVHSDGSFIAPIPLDIGSNNITIEPLVLRGQSATHLTITRQPTWWRSWMSLAEVGVSLAVIMLIIGIIKGKMSRT